MDFKELKIKEIESVVKFTPDKSEFSSKNKSWHIIGIQLSGSALHIFKDRQLVLSENSIYFFNQKDDYDVKVIEKGNGRYAIRKPSDKGTNRDANVLGKG